MEYGIRRKQPYELPLCLHSYKTWWAYALYFIVITTIIWKFIYYQKVRHELESNIRFKQMEQEK